MQNGYISKREMLQYVGLAYPAVWRRIRLGTFPKGICIGRKVWWVRAEVEHWLQTQPRQNFSPTLPKSIKIAGRDKQAHLPLPATPSPSVPVGEHP